MSPYPYADEAALALVEREQGALRRSGRATYAGPFRVEATQRGDASAACATPTQSGLEVDLEISWEPRLRPVALSQAAADLKADERRRPRSPRDGRGRTCSTSKCPPGSLGAEVTMPLRLPGAKAATLKSLARQDDGARAGAGGRSAVRRPRRAPRTRSQEVGGVTVTLNRVVQNQALWEIHMRIRVDVARRRAATCSAAGCSRTSRSCEGADGEKLDHAGFETTMQNESETGFAYFFELPEGATSATTRGSTARRRRSWSCRWSTS